MNLLPKSKEDFGRKGYWDSFFEKRGGKAFEWYGEYPELCEHLHKYIKPKDEVLIVGCGNSTLGNDLYDVGYRKLTSIDISAVAIRQMTNANMQRRPEMRFLQMDALNTSFDDASFSAIIDKGTLDALMPDDSPPTLARITRYFDELLRLLTVGGRYVCISLLQSHVLAALLDHFPKRACMFRAVRCRDAEVTTGESSMPVFMVVCTKFNTLPIKILEVDVAGKLRRVDREDDVVGIVDDAQRAAFICNGLRRTAIDDGDCVSFDLHRDGDDAPRYSVSVVDTKGEKSFKKYAVFVVPQGREFEWLFSTKEGNKQLAKMCHTKRLAVVTLHRGQQYDGLDKVKEELSECVQNFAPSSLEEKIQILSLGPDIGDRKVCFKGSSKFSGDFVVEDAVVEGNVFRRLIYLSSQLVIQSEAKLTNGKIDLTYLCCDHHIHMSRAVQVSAANKEKTTALVIGLGGGGLCTFLRKFLPKVKVTAVEIDEKMKEVAVDWFGMQPDGNLKVEIEDGLKFLRNAAKENQRFDAVLFDVDGKDTTIGMSCPPKEFLAEDTLIDVVKCLTESGMFVLNLVLRDESLRPDVLSRLHEKFQTVASVKLENELNEIFLCCAGFHPKLPELYDTATSAQNKFFTKHKNKSLIGDRTTLQIHSKNV